MCDNIIVLWLFIILKVIAIVILPIIIITKRKKRFTDILVIIDIVILLFFLICNLFTINSCVYNSNIDGIKRVKNKNAITLYNEIHPEGELGYSSDGIDPDKNYKTIKNNDFYYFNQNKPYMNNAYYTCNNKNIYMDSFGSSITSISMAISTLYDKSINPVEIFDIYKKDNLDICNAKFDVESIFNSITKRYGALTLSQIDSTSIYNEISNGGLVIAEVSANENSKLTCDSNYVVIYNISLDGGYMLAIPNQTNYDYACSYTSRAYGNVIKSDNMQKSWSLNEINNEATKYYLIKKV
ncbi:MAG: hypothetical protein J6B64_00015 [Bacilli bacterium]|nr:hypothetical protein [Bacilli bacterium]MBP3635750.1 hypothetical protein [Bacilli bacterium]